MGPDAIIFVFWMLSFKPTFSLSSFSKRLFSSSSLSAIRVVSSAYLRLLIFLLAILIPVCASFSPEFLMMYSAYKLNKQDDYIQPCLDVLLFLFGTSQLIPCPVLITQIVKKGSYFSTSSSTFVICCLFDGSHLTDLRWYLIGVLICISLMIKEYEDCRIVFELLFSTAIWFVSQEKENKNQLI